MIKIVVKAPGKMPETREIDGSLESMQEIVKGYIELVPWKGFDLFCNEDGKVMNLPMNFEITNDVICGTVFVSVSDEDGKQRSLTDAEVQTVFSLLNSN